LLHRAPRLLRPEESLEDTSGSPSCRSRRGDVVVEAIADHEGLTGAAAGFRERVAEDPRVWLREPDLGRGADQRQVAADPPADEAPFGSCRLVGDDTEAISVGESREQIPDSGVECFLFLAVLVGPSEANRVEDRASVGFPERKKS
jgi:hypothetical protein